MAEEQKDNERGEEKTSVGSTVFLTIFAGVHAALAAFFMAVSLYSFVQMATLDKSDLSGEFNAQQSAAALKDKKNYYMAQGMICLLGASAAGTVGTAFEISRRQRKRENEKASGPA